MEVLNLAKEKLAAKCSEWIKIEDHKSRWTIEDFPYVTGANEADTAPHC